MTSLDCHHISYIKVSVHHSKSYVGSTSLGIAGREASRVRKYMQRRCANVAPAIRWWRRTSSFGQFCPIVWIKCDDTIEAVYHELRAIDIRKPELNVDDPVQADMQIVLPHGVQMVIWSTLGQQG